MGQVITMQNNRGTLLAHTMGLGKTLQVISVLITLSSLASDAKVEMTPSLKKDNRRFLVVCPPTIVDNWKNEFKLWTPPECKAALGHVVTISQIDKQDRRLYKIRQWFIEGGVLIIGYSQFRQLLTAKNTELQAIEQRREWLLNPGADVVVADEAHLIKNPKALIGGLFSQIQTGSRIATTGSPLSNHLEEYYWMMQWINPGFLGSLNKFTTQYIQPIKNGLYQDSASAQRKVSNTFWATCG
jgi:SNF2 family DNA or RNA helicase